jgi:succinate dehydrogenase / fumarate reductase cytochrome b subunit
MGNLLGSSIAKKLVMSLVGLFLIIFLLVHLGINLLLLIDDPEPFTKAAHFMATFPLVKIFEIVLMAGFVVHIIWALVLQIQNWLARPIRYKRINFSQTSLFSKFMIWTGGIVLVFLIIHFINFWFIRLGLIEGDHENFYGTARELFKILGYNIVYWLAFLILAIHLHHAFQSAFQTLGLNHKKYTPAIKLIGLLYSILVPLGFALIPIVIYFFK